MIIGFSLFVETKFMDLKTFEGVSRKKGVDENSNLEDKLMRKAVFLPLASSVRLSIGDRPGITSCPEHPDGASP